MESKKCTKCNIDKDLSLFSIAKRTNDGYQFWCKECLSIANKKWRKNNKKKMKTLTDEWRKKNIDRVRALARKHYSENKEFYAKKRKRMYEKHKEKRVAYAKEWRRKNPSSNAELSRRYEAQKKNATPSWADIKRIKKMYAVARLMSGETGVQHHVDHIVPLNSDVVCGLHSHTNIQILKASENVEKGNKFILQQKQHQ